MGNETFYGDGLTGKSVVNSFARIIFFFGIQSPLLMTHRTQFQLAIKGKIARSLLTVRDVCALSWLQRDFGTTFQYNA